MSRRTRYAAFAIPQPAGWLPRLGERVYIRGGLRACGEIAMVLAEDVYKVRIEYGTRCFTKVMRIADLRPIPEPKRKRRSSQ